MTKEAQILIQTGAYTPEEVAAVVVTVDGKEVVRKDHSIPNIADLYEWLNTPLYHSKIADWML